MEHTTLPCLKCPEGAATLTMNLPGVDSQVHYVLHEGDERVFHIMLGRAIPDVELKYGRPVCHEDGSFEFPVIDGAEPEDFYGYERDGQNRRLFHPLWPDCTERAMGVLVHEKMIAVAGRCNHYLAEHFTRPVTVDQCEKCPARRANPRREPLPRTAQEFLAQCEARAKDDLKKKLGDDIFERREANLKAWQFGRTPVTSRTACSSSHGVPPAT